MRLLIEEDELDLAEALTVFFEKNHFSVDAVNDGLLRWFLPLYTRITAAIFFDICSCFSIYDLSVVLRRENNVVLVHVHRYSLLEPRLKAGVPNIKRDGNAHSSLRLFADTKILSDGSQRILLETKENHVLY